MSTVSPPINYNTTMNTPTMQRIPIQIALAPLLVSEELATRLLHAEMEGGGGVIQLSIEPLCGPPGTPTSIVQRRINRHQDVMEPLMVRAEVAAAALGGERFFRELVAAKWIAPLHRLAGNTFYSVASLKVCAARVMDGETPQSKEGEV